MVFTCLSHDIVAHETTHALLDGLHRRFIEPSNVDVWALHEAFADLVALFQHFTYPEVLQHQLARTRGDLERQNRLAELAYQFATVRYEVPWADTIRRHTSGSRRNPIRPGSSASPNLTSGVRSWSPRCSMPF